jgi:hypothetical protein
MNARSATACRFNKSGDGADHHGTTHKDVGPLADGLRHNTQNFMEFHRGIPFLFIHRDGDTGRSRSSRQKHREGAIQKVTKPN